MAHRFRRDDKRIGSVVVGNANRAIWLRGHYQDETACCLIVDEVDWPSELSGKNQSNDQIDISRLPSL